MNNRYAITTGMFCVAAMAMLVAAGMPSNVVSAADPLQVTLDMKGSGENRINLKSKGTVSVTILAADPFDPADVNAATVTFEDAMATKWSGVSGQGKKARDLKLTFNVEQLTLTTSDTVAYLYGYQNDGTPIYGSISVKVTKG